MPFRLDQFRTKVQFVTFAAMPSLIHKACVKTRTVSQTRYIQEAVCHKLAADLGVPVSELLVKLPPPRTSAARLPGTGPPTAPIETVKEEVRRVH